MHKEKMVRKNNCVEKQNKGTMQNTFWKQQKNLKRNFTTPNTKS